MALNCEIPRFTKWDRKNYYYPDLPKGYQISQFDLPLSRNGWLEIETKDVSPLPLGEGPGVRAMDSLPIALTLTLSQRERGLLHTRRIGIIRAHLEEDAGKSMHDEVAGKAPSRIDLNRAGTPLLEIVSEPDLRSPAEAKAYLTELKLLLNYLGVSDCNMQEGSLRVDANINLHIDTPEGKIATPIVEVKNMNSFRAVERALAYEAQRQWQEWQETGHKLGDVPKSTRGWDEASQTTHEQRSKEESSDYRYFPDPDLVPVTVDRGGSGAGAGVAGRTARRAPHAAGTNLRHHALRQRRVGEPGPRAGRLLCRSGRSLRRRQGGQQLDPAGRVAVARANSRSQIGQYPVRPRVAGRVDRQGACRGLRDQPRPRSARRDGCLGQVAGRGHQAVGHRSRSTTRPWSSFAASWSRPIPRSSPR